MYSLFLSRCQVSIPRVLAQTTIEKEHILNKLMTKARAATCRGSGMLTNGVTEAERLEAIAKLRDIPEWSVDQYLDNLYELSLPVDEDVVASFTDRITDLVTQVCAPWKCSKGGLPRVRRWPPWRIVSACYALSIYANTHLAPARGIKVSSTWFETEGLFSARGTVHCRAAPRT